MRRHVYKSQRALAVREDGRPRRRYAPGKGAGRGIYAVLITASLAMFAFDQAGHKLADDARGFATDFTLPVLEALSGAITATESVVRSTRDYADLAHEYEVLKAENRQLRHMRGEAAVVEARARAYETLLNYVPETSAETIAARTIADTQSPFAHSIIVNVGRERGVANGQAVLGTTGLIGRVVSTGQKTARVLLITDLDSRIPVFVGRERHRAILAGTNGDSLSLMQLPASAILADGDLVTSSGEGRLLPGGLTIGSVQLDAGGYADVVLDRRPRETEIVRVLKFSPQIDIEPNETPLPVVLMDDAEKAKADTSVAGPDVIKAAVALDTTQETPQPVE